MVSAFGMPMNDLPRDNVKMRQQQVDPRLALNNGHQLLAQEHRRSQRPLSHHQPVMLGAFLNFRESRGAVSILLKAENVSSLFAKVVLFVLLVA